MRDKIIKYWKEITAEIKEEKKVGEFEQLEWEKVWENEQKLFESVQKYMRNDEEFIEIYKNFAREYWSQKKEAEAYNKLVEDN